VELFEEFFKIKTPPRFLLIKKKRKTTPRASQPQSNPL
jgi:ribosomal protein L11